MIEHFATVIEVAGRRVTVTAQRAAGCGACAAGGGCGAGVLGRLFGNRASRMEVISEIEVRPGDQVVIGVREEALLKGSLRVYLVPLLLFIGGSLVGSTVAVNTGTGEWLAVLGGLLGGAAGLGLTALEARRDGDGSAYLPVVLQRIGAPQLDVPGPT